MKPKMTWVCFGLSAILLVVVLVVLWTVPVSVRGGTVRAPLLCFTQKARLLAAAETFTAPPSFTILPPIDTRAAPSETYEAAAPSPEAPGTKQSSCAPFIVTDKWKLSLAPARNQGKCGSCWAFACTDMLASRFACLPKIFHRDLEDALAELGELYGIRKTTLRKIFDALDTETMSSPGKITRKEWGGRYDKLSAIVFAACVGKERAANGDVGRRYYAAHGCSEWWKHVTPDVADALTTLNIMLTGNEGESMLAAEGSVARARRLSTGSRTVTLDEADAMLREQAMKMFDVWLVPVTQCGGDPSETACEPRHEGETTTGHHYQPTDAISLSDWRDYYEARPLDLSVEVLLACNPDQIRNKTDLSKVICGGSSLSNALNTLYTTGTVPSLCSGYNLENFTSPREGTHAPTCQDLLGPGFSFCRGTAPGTSPDLSGAFDEAIQESHREHAPVHVPAGRTPDGNRYPWMSPNFFVFKCHKPYQLAGGKVASVETICAEIRAHGPVVTGIHVFQDFLHSFGGAPNLGGKRLINENVGGVTTKKGNASATGFPMSDLIYGADPSAWTRSGASGETIPADLVNNPQEGGHAILLVGWGTFTVPKANDSRHSVDYWVVQNSWGTEWGLPLTVVQNVSQWFATPDRAKKIRYVDNGFFLMRKGVNLCGVEENVWTALPNTDNIVHAAYRRTVPRAALPSSRSPFPPAVVKGTGFVIGSSDYYYEPHPATAAGQYNTGNATLSMHPPSPFTLKWPSSRPRYELATLRDPLADGTGTRLKPSTLGPFRALFAVADDECGNVHGDTARKRVGCPKQRGVKEGSAIILRIGDELLRVTPGVREDGTVTVERGVWSTAPSAHARGAPIYAFPYKHLHTHAFEDALLRKGKVS